MKRSLPTQLAWIVLSLLTASTLALGQARASAPDAAKPGATPTPSPTAYPTLQFKLPVASQDWEVSVWGAREYQFIRIYDWCIYKTKQDSAFIALAVHVRNLNPSRNPGFSTADIQLADYQGNTWKVHGYGQVDANIPRSDPRWVKLSCFECSGTEDLTRRLVYPIENPNNKNVPKPYRSCTGCSGVITSQDVYLRLIFLVDRDALRRRITFQFKDAPPLSFLISPRADRYR